ncbi:uncharacterized protein [Watersipora subatra]|uniref:uncharacterized protein n=1 Tax=Watersipora subatra TaxID=2589382 RepID=UPI00355BC52F
MHADDAALCAASQDDLQLLLNHFSEACSHLGLHISLKKTVTLSQSNEANIFSIDETVLQDVDKFTYLESSLTQNTTLDHEIPRRLGFSSSTFGKLTGLVKAKTCVYEACFSVFFVVIQRHGQLTDHKNPSSVHFTSEASGVSLEKPGKINSLIVISSG